VANDDPELKVFMGLEKFGLANIRCMDNVGCEKFAESVFNHVAPKIKERTKGRVSLFSVECFEHGANSAIYQNPYGSTVI
jgi:6-pyruvoyltetrahydropterin/6-carboxytetrahydropterin synthase